MNIISLRQFHFPKPDFLESKAYILQNWHYWSSFVTSMILIISAIRCQYYYNIVITPNNSGYIFNFLAKCEPMVTISEYIYFGVILCQKKKVEKLVQNVVLLSTRQIKRIMFVVVFLTILMLFYLYKMVFKLLCTDSVRYQVKLDSVVYGIQITVRACHLLFIAVMLFVINFGLSSWRKEFAHTKHEIRDSYKELIHISDLYNGFSNLFYYVMKINVVHCFYGVLCGMKRIEDALKRAPDDIYGKYDGIIIYLNLFHFPMILIICHAGEVFKEQVKLMLFVSNFLLTQYFLV